MSRPGPLLHDRLDLKVGASCEACGCQLDRRRPGAPCPACGSTARRLPRGPGEHIGSVLSESPETGADGDSLSTTTEGSPQ